MDLSQSITSPDQHQPKSPITAMTAFVQNPALNFDSAMEKTTLLDVPPEIRHLIYQHLLRVDTNVDVPDDAVPARLDLTLLHVNRQLRKEASDYLFDSNLWSRVTIESEEVDVIREPGSIPHIPLSLLPPHERQHASSKASLHLYIGDLLQTNDYFTSVLHNDILACNTVGSQIAIPKVLVKRRLEGQPALINFRKGLKQHLIEQLILPFARLRGRIGVPWIDIVGIEGVKLANTFKTAINGDNFRFEDYHEQIIAFREEGDKFLTKGHLRAAASCYLDGLRIAKPFLDRNTVFERRPNLARVVMIQSIVIELANDFGLATNQILALSRGSEGILPPQSIHMIANQVVNMYHFAFSLYYMTDQQRSQAHHSYSVALQNLGEYLLTPEYRDYMIFHVSSTLLPHIDREPSDVFQEATANAFYALHANKEPAFDPLLFKRFKDMSHKYGFYVSREPHLVTVNDLRWRTDWTWTGDPRLVEDWNEIEMMRAHPVVGLNDMKARTQEEMNQMRRGLGLPIIYCEGFTRLLCVGLIEYEEVFENDRA